MHRMTFTAALALALAGSVAMAQQPQAAPAPQTPQGAPMGHHGGRHHHHPDAHAQAMMMSKRLNLSADQTAKVEPILANREQKVAALRADSSLTPEARMQQVRALHQETRQQFASVLSPEQLQQLKSMRHGREGRGMHHHGQGQAPATGL